MAAAMATYAMEKIWVDKSSYDKAERQYFERMAKLGSCCKLGTRKIVEDCTLKSDNSVTDKCQDLINTNTLRSKTEKSKDNKLALESESSESGRKRSKCQGRNAKINKEVADVCNMQNKENIKATEKSDSSKDNAKEKEGASERPKKYNAKEAKEKKNKEDTKNKNRDSGGSGTGKNKDNAMSCAKNKEQLSDQGTQQSNTCPILPVGSLANEVAKARQHIKQSLQCMDDIEVLAHIANHDVTPRIVQLEKENQDLRSLVQDLKHSLEKLVKHVNNLASLEDRVDVLEKCVSHSSAHKCSAKSYDEEDSKRSKENKDKEEDFDLFGSDSEGEDAEAAKIREERLAAYAAKKSKKPVLIAKSNIILDVKPWDDETDMKEMEAAVRNIETDGLLWGASKLVPLAFGIHKLQISCVVEDEKVSVDWLTEQIQDLEDYVQSVDIAAFNKV